MYESHPYVQRGNGLPNKEDILGQHRNFMDDSMGNGLRNKDNILSQHRNFMDDSNQQQQSYLRFLQ